MGNPHTMSKVRYTQVMTISSCGRSYSIGLRGPRTSFHNPGPPQQRQSPSDAFVRPIIAVTPQFRRQQ
jgi:hypothetical protein